MATIGRRGLVTAISGLAASTVASAPGSWRTPNCRRVPRPYLRGVSSSCDEVGNKWRRPAAGTSDTCDPSGIKYYAARAKKAADSDNFYAVAATYNQFAVAESLVLADKDGGSEAASAACAKLCAGRLPLMTANAFVEGVRRRPLHSTVRDDGSMATEEEAASALWADAISSGFNLCEAMIARDLADGGRGAAEVMLCVIARSGVYAGSVGRGRIVVGTEENGDIWCDEASCPHLPSSEAEMQRIDELMLEGAGAGDNLPEGQPTRFLGGGVLKERDSRYIGLPDIVRLDHVANSRRFVIIGSSGIWSYGPRLPVQWAIEAYRSGRSPADELISRSTGSDDVVLVLILPPKVAEGSTLPPHHEIVLN
mmetsp:Transcript_84998/g.177642  ORF Transcript_84998/g.177642 Transcript_84998/m.177642 type:complete len:367 (-) Transcript_84998:61-1161(-)